MKRFISIMLAICCLATMLPVYGANNARAEAVLLQDAQAAAAEQGIEVNEAVFCGCAQRALSGEYPVEDDGEWQYIVLPEENYAVITGHTDRGSAQVDIPAELGGADVVALLDGVFNGHDALCCVTMAGNIYYAGADALPLGVSVRGYRGSYAEKWAADHRHAFENLSEMDFVSGVIDCSDISEYNFVRYDETRVDMRALEARRLRVGSVFFLLDPYNPYAVSYYKAESIGEAQNGYVTIRCSTPDISLVLNSFNFEDAPMVPDWNTMETAEGVSVTRTGMNSRALTSASSNFGAKFTLESKKLKDGSKISMELDFSSTTKVSSEYANLSLETFKIVSEETKGITFKKEAKTNWDKSTNDAGELLSTDEMVNAMIEGLRQNKKSLSEWETIPEDCPLSSVYLVSWAGILSLRMDIGIKVETAGSFEVGGKIVTKTTHSYANGNLKSTTKEKENILSFEGMASGKFGPYIALKLLVANAECASASLFAGISASAAMNGEFAVEGNLTGKNIIEAIEACNMSLAYLNMMDCVEIKVTLLVEGKLEIGGDFFNAAEFKITPIQLHLLDLHYHINPKKFILNDSGKVDTAVKTLKDAIHNADECPLTDSVHLMVPSIDKAEPMGSVTLMGQSQLESAPKLQLPDHGVRVSRWYKNFTLSEPIEAWPHPVTSGDYIYGETVEIKEINLVAYDGSALLDTSGNPVKFYLEEGESLALNGDTGLADWDHIIGWAYIDPVSFIANGKINFLGDVMPGNELNLTGDGQSHILLAIRDNDLTIRFRDENGDACGELVTGHFIEVAGDLLPEFPVPFDPSYAVAEYEWCDYNGTSYPFPHTFDETTGEEITLVMTLADIDRVYTADTSATVMTGSAAEPDGLTTYSDPAFFTYTIRNSQATITGFKAKQSYTDENGDTQTWTAVPEKLVLPASIDGYPVTAIGGDAFEKITTLVSFVAPASVTSIGGGAFAGCTSLVTLDLSACSNLTEFPSYGAQNCSLLSNVRLPGSVTGIGDYAFYGCSSLQTASTHASIGVQAFNGCTSLREVELKTGVQNIGRYAFYNCAALEELYIPCSVESIGDSFINGCTGLTSITFDGAPGTITAGMMNIGSGSSLTTVVMNLGVLDIGDKAFSNGSYGNPRLTGITLPDALRSVGNYALQGTAVEYLKIGNLGLKGTGGIAYGCATLKEVEIMGGVVGMNAFRNCSALEKVTLHDEVVAIANDAFYGCGKLATVETGDGVESVGAGAFYNCYLLSSFDAGEKLTFIGERAFYNCRAMTTVNIGGMLTTVDKYAFAGSSALTELHFPPTVENFGECVIEDCSGLQKLTIGGEKTPELMQMWIGDIPDSQLTTLVIGDGVTDTGARFIQTFTSLENLTLPSTLETIGSYAFYKIASLKSVNLPAGLTDIGEHAFEGCSAMNLVCPEDLQLVTIGASAFKNCGSLTGINLGDRLQLVGSYAFSGCSSLAELHFPPTVISIGDYAMQGCSSMKRLSIGGPAMPVTHDNWFDGISSARLEEVTIGEGVTEIGAGTFANKLMGFPALHTVNLPSTLETIGQSAFYKCSALGEVKLPSALVEIGNTAFQDCKALTLVCPEDMNLIRIGDSAFRDCQSLTSINLGSELESVGGHAFLRCYALEELRFPPSVKEMGNYVYDYCTSLKLLSVGGPNLPVLAQEMSDMHGTDGVLETLIIHEGVVTIGDSAFSNNLEGLRRLKTVVLPSTLETIGNNAFYNASALTALELPAGLKEIGYAAFQNCTALDLACPDNLRLESIGENAFRNCSSLTGIKLTPSLKWLGDSAFYDCASLRALYVPASATLRDEYVSTSAYLLHGCTSMKVLSIGGPYEPVICHDMFSYKMLYNDTLETVIINEGVTTIDTNAFNHGFYALKNISLPSTLKTIGSYVFDNCSSLQHLVLPDGITSIDPNAFYRCNAFKSVSSNAYSPVIAEFAEAKGLTYTWNDVSYTLTLMDGENQIACEELAAGAGMESLLAQHEPADRDATTFRAWYADAGCTAEWMMDSMPTCDLTLYAGMTPVYTARFSAVCGGDEIWYEEYPVGAGLAMPWPNEPACPGYVFDGWFTDSGMTRRYVHGMTMGDGDTTIYGRLRPGSIGAIFAEVTGSYALRGDGYILTDLRLGENDGAEVWLPGMYNGLPVVGIAANAFENADNITRLHLPDQLKQIDPGALEDLANLQAFSTGANSKNYTAVGGVLYTKDMQSLVCFPRKKPTLNFRVPDGVQAIESGAFRNAEWITNVVLPDSVTSLGSGAFAGCARLASFTAYGLEDIGDDALPVFNANLQVFGPVQTGALRQWLMLSDSGSYPTFKARYNVYKVALYLDGGLVRTLGIEAGSVLPADFIYGEMENGSVIHDWFLDAQMQNPWSRDDKTPAQDISLYTATTLIYEYETAQLTDANGNAVSGVRLTAYNGVGGALVLPRSINGMNVIGIGENFFAGCRNSVTSVQIGSEVIFIADTALNAPADAPFGGVVKADAGSYAAEWAKTMGYTVNDGTYALRFETNGGSIVAERSVACGAYVKLPDPVKTGDEFLGWFADAALTVPVELSDGCYVMPGADTTLYASWAGTAAAWTFDFEVLDGEISITAYTGAETQLTIPKTINGMPVARIADYAFEDNQTLTTVTLPASIVSIGNGAFRGTAVQTIDLGGAQTIGKGAFSGCANLAQLAMNSAQSLGDGAFYGCASLEQIHIPASMTSIGREAFEGCAALEAFTADEGSMVYTVQDGVLICDGMVICRYPQAKDARSYIVPEGICSIADGAFRGAKNLEEIILPDTLGFIGSEAFAGCAQLGSIAFTDAMYLAAIPEGAFSGCASLTEIALGSNVYSIGSRAFFGCSALQRIHIPESVEEISAAAFSAAQAEKITILGAYGSPAWSYAMEHGFAFEDPDLVPVDSIAIDTLPVLCVGDRITLAASVSPADAEPCGDIAWASSDADVIYIRGNTACAMAPGEATITATAPNGVRVSGRFEVLETIQCGVSAAELTLCAGQAVTVCAWTEPELNVPVAYWTTSDTRVASVRNGTICAGGAGDAVVTAVFAGGTQMQVRVRVAENLNTLQQPALLTQIEEAAYEGLPQIQRIAAGEGLASIGPRAFADMTALVQAQLPASLADIAKDAFSGSSGVVVICEEGSRAEAFAIENKLPYVNTAE